MADRGPMFDEHTYTPLAYFSSITLAEHNETIQHLTRLQEDITHRRQQLINSEREHAIEHDARQGALADEEAQVRLAMERTDASMDKFRVMRENDEACLLEDLKHNQNEVEELQQQLRALDDAEADLRRMQLEMSERYQGLADRRREFLRRFENAASDIEQVRAHTRNVGVEVHKLEEVHSARAPQHIRATSPLRGVNAGASAAGGGAYSMSRRTLSPPRGGSAAGTPRVSFADTLVTTSAGTFPVSSASVAAAMARPPSPRCVSPARPGRGSTVEAGARSTPLPPAAGRLVALCAAGDVEPAMQVIKEHPGDVNTIDAAGNTPLHAACSSSVVSLPLVTALLLAGASTSAKNDDGLTPFHLAAINTSDHGQLTGHRLKRHMIFKAAVSPNQRTSRGETAAHLCAVNDRHLDSLRFLVGSGLDLDIKAVSPSPLDVQAAAAGDAASNSRAITAREKAARCGAPKTVEFLESLPR